MNDIKNDINLKEAVSRREQQLPPMPEGLNEKVMGSLEEYDCLKKKTPLHRGRGWRWVFLAAACVAGFVVIFLAPPKSAEKQPPLALEKPRVESQEPIADSQFSTPLKGRLGSLELPLNVATAPQRGANPHSRRRERMEGASQLSTVNSQEPMLAEAEINASHLGEVGRGALPEMEDPFLAIAEQMQDIRSRGEQIRQVVAQLIDNQVNLQ